jgi:hypothetical protein
MDLAPAKPNTQLWERSQRRKKFKNRIQDERYCEVDYVVKEILQLTTNKRA